MRRLFRVTALCAVVVVTILILTQTSMLESILAVIYGETQNSQAIFEDNWYFNTLSKKEQEIYSKIDMVINNYENKVVEVGDGTLSASMVSRAYEAYLLDNPECFYLKTKYELNEAKFLNVTKLELKVDYTLSKTILSEKIQELNKKVEQIISKVITPNMTDFEKEVALHDYLIENVNYYDYTDIDEIPSIKHSAYGALIEKEAVCDGISKAYSILLNKCGIENVVVTGKMDVRHAWNKVKLDDEWYNTDVTSDACGKEIALSHVYFNLTDIELSNTHVLSSGFSTPECRAEKYNYYEYNDFKITTQDFFTDKIKKVIENSDEKVLEVKLGTNIDVQAVAQELYNQNFNNYKTNNIREVKYFYIQDIMVIPK